MSLPVENILSTGILEGIGVYISEKKYFGKLSLEKRQRLMVLCVASLLSTFLQPGRCCPCEGRHKEHVIRMCVACEYGIRISKQPSKPVESLVTFSQTEFVYIIFLVQSGADLDHKRP